MSFQEPDVVSMVETKYYKIMSYISLSFVLTDLGFEFDFVMKRNIFSKFVVII